MKWTLTVLERSNNLSLLTKDSRITPARENSQKRVTVVGDTGIREYSCQAELMGMVYYVGVGLRLGYRTQNRAALDRDTQAAVLDP